MILAIDMGNTNITLGCYKGDRLLFVSRMYTERHKTSDEFAVQMLELFRLHNVSPSDFSGAVLSSVVPQLTDIIARRASLQSKKRPSLLARSITARLRLRFFPFRRSART